MNLVALAVCAENILVPSPVTLVIAFLASELLVNQRFVHVAAHLLLLFAETLVLIPIPLAQTFVRKPSLVVNTHVLSDATMVHVKHVPKSVSVVHATRLPLKFPVPTHLFYPSIDAPLFVEPRLIVVFVSARVFVAPKQLLLMNVLGSVTKTWTVRVILACKDIIRGHANLVLSSSHEVCHVTVNVRLLLAAFSAVKLDRLSVLTIAPNKIDFVGILVFISVTVEIVMPTVSVLGQKIGSALVIIKFFPTSLVMTMRHPVAKPATSC